MGGGPGRTRTCNQTVMSAFLLREIQENKANGGFLVDYYHGPLAHIIAVFVAVDPAGIHGYTT